MSSIQISGVKAVVFDLDDTLYPERSFIDSGFEAVGQWLRGRMVCPFDPAARMREIFETGERRRVFDRLLAELHGDQPQALIPLMVEVYREHRPVIQLFEDAERLLQRWRGALPLGLISDGPLRTQQNKVVALGLADRIEQIILTDQWGPAFWKPHPRAFEVLQEKWGWDGPACLYIADNAEKDFIAPVRLGWRTVRIIRPRGIYADRQPPAGGAPELSVSSLLEIELSS